MNKLNYTSEDELISSSELQNQMLNIGVALRALRINRGYKCAEQFAFTHQLNRSAYYGWENGGNISMKKLIVVCAALEISLPEFFKLVKIPDRQVKQNKEAATM